MYREILKKKDKFNEDINKLCDEMRNDIQKLIEAKNTGRKTTIELPLRFSLLKINETNDVGEQHVNRILEENIAHLNNKEFFEHRTDEINNELIDFMKAKRNHVVNCIKKFKIDIQELNQLIEKFQGYVKPISIRSILG